MTRIPESETKPPEERFMFGAVAKYANNLGSLLQIQDIHDLIDRLQMEEAPPELIARRKAAIQATWTDKERAAHYVGEGVVPAGLPEVEDTLPPEFKRDPYRL